MAFCDLAGDMEVAEAFLKHLLRTALSECAEDMEFFDERIQKGIRANLEQIVRSPFRRIPYTEAIGILERSGEAFTFPVEWGLDLQTEHERFLADLARTERRRVIVALVLAPALSYAAARSR